MMFKTHLMFGFLVGLLSVTVLQPANQIVFMLIVLIGSALPDIDHPNSKVGKNFQPFNKLLEHRGFFHSFFMLFIIFALSMYLGWKSVYGYALIIGYGSHLAADILNHQGIMPLHPFSRKRLKGFIKTNSILEYVFMFLVFVISIVQLLKMA